MLDRLHDGAQIRVRTNLVALELEKIGNRFDDYRAAMDAPKNSARTFPLCSPSAGTAP
jgi:hypothetical protein